MVELLVSRGADVTLAQTDGTTALMLAAGVKYSITQQGDPAEPRQPGRRLGDRQAAAREGRGPERGERRGETALYGAAFVGAQQGHHAIWPSMAAGLDARTKQGLTVLDGALNTGVADDGTGVACRRQARAGDSGPGTGADGGGRSSADDVERRRRSRCVQGPARETPKPPSK